MIKIICFTLPPLITFFVKQYISKNEFKLINVVGEWILYFIVINLFVCITALPFGSTIITKCEQHAFHIQYGLLAIVMSNIYAVVIGIFCSVVAMSRNIDKEKL